MFESHQAMNLLKNRIDILNRMIRCLRERSSAGEVHASPRASASSPLSTRDMPEPSELLAKLDGCEGTMQSKSAKRRLVMELTSYVLKKLCSRFFRPRKTMSVLSLLITPVCQVIHLTW